MQITGISFTVNDDGKKKSTLYVVSDFDPYYKDEAEGKRGCIGKKTETIYAGEYDVSNLRPGMSIEVSYDKAISTRNGVYRPIKRIDVLSSTGKQQT
ncbi:MAG: hypothetical protein IJC04_01600 [Oscillospiraceae bacterium]|nr:hypothetical protein [Oscillospiraceae bacterium]